MDFLEYKGYKGSVEYSKEDNCLFGKVQGMSKDLITYEGLTLEELRKDFEEGIDSYIEGCKADGVEPAKPYSGKLNLLRFSYGKGEYKKDYFFRTDNANEIAKRINSYLKNGFD